MHKKYPSCIVPKSRYRYRLPMRKLLSDYPDLAVVRRCKHPQPFAYSTNNKHEQLRTDVFCDEDLRELSVNLLGGLYKMKHLPFAPNLDLVKEEWDGHTLPSLPVTNESFSDKGKCGIIGFRVAEVNRCAFPYQMALQKSDYEKRRKGSEHIRRREQLDIKGEVLGVFGQADNGDTLVYAWLHVNHRPNSLNYWHMQIDVYPAGVDEYLRGGKSSGESRRIKHRLREKLSRIAIWKLGNSYYIGQRYYMHRSQCVLNTIDDLKNLICRKCVKFAYSPLYVQ